MNRAIKLLLLAMLVQRSFVQRSFVPVSVAGMTVAQTRNSFLTATQQTDYWPVKEWRSSTPEQQGVDSVKLAEALTAIKQRDIRIHSVLLVRNGYIILEAYFFPFDRDSFHDLASVTKSVTSTLVGIAIDQHRIRSVNQPVADIFPRRTIANKDDRKANLTIESLLTMTSGLACQPAENELTLHQMMNSKDWVQFMLDLPMAANPGEKFVYSAGACTCFPELFPKPRE